VMYDLAQGTTRVLDDALPALWMSDDGLPFQVAWTVGDCLFTTSLTVITPAFCAGMIRSRACWVRSTSARCYPFVSAEIAASHLPLGRCGCRM